MGLFDDTRCDVPTPDGVIGSCGHTKEFDCVLQTVVINSNGQILLPRGYHVEVPLEERPYQNEEDGWKQIIVSMRWVEEEPELNTTFTGTINVGKYDAVFLRGVLQGFQNERDPSTWYPYSPYPSLDI